MLRHISHVLLIALFVLWGCPSEEEKPDTGVHADASVTQDAANPDATTGLDVGFEDGGTEDAGQDTTPPTVTITAPAPGSVVSGTVLVSADAQDDVAVVNVSFGLDGAAVQDDATAPYEISFDTTAFADGAHTVTATAWDAAGNSATASIGLVINNSGLPPDPADIAPDVNPTTATGIGDATSFLYEGPTPIQTGVAGGTIDKKRVTVVRGRVLDRARDPLPGVTVTILDHPELGQTLSRIDGRYDLVVNGGGQVTLDFSKQGFIPAQRRVDTPWQQYVAVADVMLIALDAAVTTIDLSSPDPIQVARGSAVTDQDGTRQGTLLIPQGTTASMIMADGSTKTIGAMDVRITEYTVGTPEAMPAILPPSSGYTYAMELSADEAVAAGAKSVRFNQPLYYYVENFVGFPAGIPVPAGYYDRDVGCWIPSEDGIVLEVLSIDKGNLAVLDVDGDGAPDSGQALLDLGITDEERSTLATLYQAGQRLWRVPITHFTPWDCNWPYGPPLDAIPPSLLAAWLTMDPKELCPELGSLIGCEGQVLGERVDVAGTPFALHYSSDRVVGRNSGLTIPISGSNLPASLKRIELSISAGGRSFGDQNITPTPDQSFLFQWDGVDAYGRPLQGMQTADIQVNYVYDAVYLQPGPFQRSFGRLGGAELQGTRGRSELKLVQRQSRPVSGSGFWDARGQGLGGWTLSEHHAYDPVGRILYRGDGNKRAVNDKHRTIHAVAGNGTRGDSGDGGSALEAQLNADEVTVGPDGSLYIVDESQHRVRRVAPDGIISTFAGNGTAGYSGDGGPATAANLNRPGAVALAPDGSAYIAEYGNCSVRRVAPDGTISTYAGDGTCGFDGDGGPATSAHFSRITSVAYGPDCSLYLTDPDNYSIRRVNCDGIVETVIGNGTSGFSGDGGPAVLGQIGWVEGISLGPDGSLYLIDFDDGSSGARIRRIDAQSGIVTTVGGDGTWGTTGDGGPATSAKFSWPLDLAVGPDGSVYVTDGGGGYAIRRITPDGMMERYAGGSWGWFVDGSPAVGPVIDEPYGVDVGPDGSVYLADNDYYVKRITPPLPGFSSNDIVIASKDGKSVFHFDPNGRHLRTLNAMTGAVRFTFSYDGAGRLDTLSDSDGNVTTIERDTTGAPIALLGPFGHRTVLVTNPDGYLQSIANPVGDTHQLTYHSADGLLASFTTPNGETYNFTYDVEGRLTRDADPAGGQKDLALTRLGGQDYQVSVTTALGRVTTYRLEGSDLQQRTTTLPNGTQNQASVFFNGAINTLADGTEISFSEAPDPRWGMQASFPASFTIQMPSGLSLSRVATREATIADPHDRFSLVDQTDTIETNGRTRTREYDASSRTSTVTTPESRQFSWQVDAQGRLVRYDLPGLAPITFQYDAQGRMESMNHVGVSETRTVQLSYGADGLLADVTDPLARTVGFGRDAAGRLTRTIFPSTSEIVLGYDGNGNLASFTPSTSAHSFLYNAVDQTSSYTPPAMPDGIPQTSFVYDADHQLTSATRLDNSSFTFGYDTAGRLETATLPRGTITLGYDGVTGTLTTITSPDGGSVAFTYDGRLITQTTWAGTVVGSVSRTYDDNLVVVSQSVGAGPAIARTYDNDLLLTQAGALSLTRDAVSGLITGTGLGSVTDTRTYTEFGEPDSYTATFGSPLYDATYTWDAAGRLVGVSESVEGAPAVAYDYTYDDDGRLTEVREDTALVNDYTYDASGNRTGDGTTTATYDARDRLVLYGTTDYVYSPNGELQSKTVGPDTTGYVYGALGNLMEVNLPDTTAIEYVVDGLNRRIGKKRNGVLEQGFLYKDRINPIAEIDGNNAVVSRFVYGAKPHVPDYMIKGGSTYRLITDHLGSVRLVVEMQTGSVAQRIDYDAFGKILQDTAPGFQPFGFAGGLYDADTGLTRFGARDYDATVGRWTSTDPLGFVAGINPFVYALNSPQTYIDPEGKIVWFIPIVAAVVGVAVATVSSIKASDSAAALERAEYKAGSENYWEATRRLEEDSTDVEALRVQEALTPMMNGRGRLRCAVAEVIAGAQVPGTLGPGLGPANTPGQAALQAVGVAANTGMQETAN